MNRRRVSIETDSDRRDTGLINPHTVIVLIQNARTYVRVENAKPEDLQDSSTPLQSYGLVATKTRIATEGIRNHCSRYNNCSVNSEKEKQNKRKRP